MEGEEREGDRTWRQLEGDGEGGRGFSPQIGERVDAATGTAAYARAPRQYGRR